MSAGLYKMLCEQGATFQLALTWKDASGQPVDMQGFTAKMQVRKSKTADEVLLQLSSDDGSILLDNNGNIFLDASAAQTQLLKDGQYVYDIEINTGSTIVRLLEGAFVVNGEVTR